MVWSLNTQKSLLYEIFVINLFPSSKLEKSVHKRPKVNKSILTLLITENANLRYIH